MLDDASLDRRPAQSRRFLDRLAAHFAMRCAQEEAMEQARSGLRKTMRRLNRTYERSKSNHILYLLLFAVGVFAVLYTWIKFYRLVRWVI